MFFLRFLIVIAVLVFVMFLQTSRVLEIMSVRPNLVLISFLFFAYSLADSKEGRVLFAVSAISFLGLCFWFFDFWFWEVMVIVILSAALSYARRFLTGGQVIDFVLILSISTLLFYLILSASGIGRIPLKILPAEILYGFILGLAPWYFLKKNYEKI